MFKKIPGTKDILPQEVVLWQRIEQISRNIFSLYNYREIRPPLIEENSLFNRSLGESTEIVQKQMFLIRNQDDLYALRPEGTASVVRAYIENDLAKKEPFVKLFYIGAMFRLERPQKGRLRQFHHIGTEVIGSEDPDIDIEVISLADKLLKSFAIENYEIKINSLGCKEDKKKLTNILNKELKTELKDLCPECNLRFEKNILRILDCKNQQCQEIIKKLNLQDKYLCKECTEHFSKVKTGLEALDIKFEPVPSLVRGLDYYTRTVFEIKHGLLGAQDAIGAGGRYDNLVKELGGPDAAAIGFAFGVERILLVVEAQNKNILQSNGNLVYMVTLGKEAKQEGAILLNKLRLAGITSDTDYENKSLKGAMRRANDLKARFVLILGDDELKKGIVTLKDMVSGEQKEIKSQELIQELLASLKS